MNSNDLRVQKTVENIYRAFYELTEEKDYSEITVKELSERAKINKKTFYRHYSSLDNLLAEIYSKISDEFIEKILNYNIPQDLDKINREFFLFSEKNGKLYEKILCDCEYFYAKQRMIDNVMNTVWKKSEFMRKMNKYKQNIFLSFVRNAGVEMYKQWIADGRKIPIEEMIEMTNEIMCNGISSFI